MHFTTLFFATLIATSVALPHRGSDEGNQGVRSQGYRGNRRPTVTKTAIVTEIVTAQPTATIAPPNNQNGNNGNNGNQNGDIGNGNGNGNNGNNGNGNDNNDNLPPANDDFAALVPEFGIEPGQQPDGRGNCVGVNNVLIPCTCPPDREDFIQMVQAAAVAGNSEGVSIEFPTGNSSEDVKARIGASIVVLQNLNGRGVGCPAAATTFLQQQAEA